MVGHRTRLIHSFFFVQSLKKTKYIHHFGTGTRLPLLGTIGAEHCIICEGSRGPGAFLFAVAELLKLSGSVNKAGKTAKGWMAGGEKGTSSDAQELLWQLFPAVCIVLCHFQGLVVLVCCWLTGYVVGELAMLASDLTVSGVFEHRQLKTTLLWIGSVQEAEQTFMLPGKNIKWFIIRGFREEKQRLSLFNSVRHVHLMRLRGH